MRAAVLHGKRDFRIEQVDEPGAPARGKVAVRVESVGVCGSDLHVYLDGTIGDTVLDSPLILGHEFGGVIEAVGEDAHDGEGRPLEAGMRVAVDPSWHCGHCDLCVRGDTNLCRHHTFCGLYPYDGALRERMVVPGSACFPVPSSISADATALLEPLGVAIHTTDLSKIRVGDRVSVLGAGPIGLYITRLACLAGAAAVIVSEPHAWRREAAAAMGSQVIAISPDDLADAVEKKTGGDGMDIAIEAAWAGSAVEQAAATLRPGGRLVLVGIPAKDELSMPHAMARRKGLTIVMVRRMRNPYPRAIRLVEAGLVDLDATVSHRFPLEQAEEAFNVSAAYEDRVLKTIISMNAG